MKNKQKKKFPVLNDTFAYVWHIKGFTLKGITRENRKKYDLFPTDVSCIVHFIPVPIEIQDIQLNEHHTC